MRSLLNLLRCAGLGSKHHWIAQLQILRLVLMLGMVGMYHQVRRLTSSCMYIALSEVVHYFERALKRSCSHLFNHLQRELAFEAKHRVFLWR